MHASRTAAVVPRAATDCPRHPPEWSRGGVCIARHMFTLSMLRSARKQYTRGKLAHVRFPEDSAVAHMCSAFGRDSREDAGTASAPRRGAWVVGTAPRQRTSDSTLSSGTKPPEPLPQTPQTVPLWSATHIQGRLVRAEFIGGLRARAVPLESGPRRRRGCFPWLAAGLVHSSRRPGRLGPRGQLWTVPWWPVRGAIGSSATQCWV